MNFVVRELYLNKAVTGNKQKTSLPKTCLKAFSGVLESSYVLMLEGEEQMVVLYIKFQVMWLLRIYFSFLFLVCFNLGKLSV